MALEPIRIPHGQSEGKDVADMPYGDEMWTTEFVGLAMEREEGGEMRFKVVLHAYRHLRWDGDAIRRVGRTFASDSPATSLLKPTSSLHPNLPIVHLPQLIARCHHPTRSG